MTLVVVKSVLAMMDSLGTLAIEDKEAMEVTTGCQGLSFPG